MPIYLYKNPKTGEIKEVIQSMNEEHVYSEGKVKFERIFTSPMGIVDGKVDAWNPRAFKDKVSSTKGTMGDLWDRSAELSEKRAQQSGGKDPIKEKYLKDYSKKRNGKPHVSQLKNKG